MGRAAESWPSGQSSGSLEGWGEVIVGFIFQPTSPWVAVGDASYIQMSPTDDAMRRCGKPTAYGPAIFAVFAGYLPSQMPSALSGPGTLWRTFMPKMLGFG